ncbi:Radical SAM domain protein [Halothece sp. PCC 7418]|uniref:7-carboxy-7-deazaguanine synthase QueE n=1 Tax=Halothece sp. (strain PCC 7418) TaxID=65093 RepID=UPI0002A08B26|nr:7-carboxy-7-deazaguanine synthase QueE [Halothece sp. PCC 7418]AFZ42533.1 Radical SAM domain protein [Halothece sp. PCC 7418]
MTAVKTATANLVEVFSAIQGEGLNVGTRQIFVRFGGCDLRCHFCDSEQTWEKISQCRIEKTSGQRDFEVYANPVTQEQLLSWIRQQNQNHLHDSISLTGGEPLLHAKFLQQFLPQLKAEVALPIYLETGGHRPQQVSLLLDYIDCIGMDMKLPSVSGEKHWQAHADFLRVCIPQTNLFVKLIVSDQTSEEDLVQARSIIAKINAEIPVILQPATPISREAIFPPNPEQVLAWQGLLKESLFRVRVIPQTHKMIGQL